MRNIFKDPMNNKATGHDREINAMIKLLPYHFVTHLVEVAALSRYLEKQIWLQFPKLGKDTKTPNNGGRINMGKINQGLY